METITVGLRGGINIAPNTVEAPMPTLDNVRLAYSGKPGCMCGCNGNYRVNPKFVEEATANRGYGYDEEEVNAKSVKMFIKRLLEAGAYTDEGKEKSYLYAELPGRTYVVYFADCVK